MQELISVRSFLVFLAVHAAVGWTGAMTFPSIAYGQAVAAREGTNLVGTCLGTWQGKHQGELTLTVERHEGGKVKGKIYIIDFTLKDEGKRPFDETVEVEGTFRNGRLYLTGYNEMYSDERRTRIFDVRLVDGGSLKGDYKVIGWIKVELKCLS